MEVMVTLVVFTIGIVFILKTLMHSLDQIQHLTVRHHAHTVINNRLSTLERSLRVYNALPFDLNYVNKVALNGKTIEFKQNMNIKEIEDFPDVFRIDLSLHWKEGERPFQLSRSAYISDFKPLYDED